MAATHEPEKINEATHDENGGIGSNSPPSSADEFDPHNEKKLMRKVDWRLLPILGALYSIALIDRVNVSLHYKGGQSQGHDELCSNFTDLQCSGRGHG